MYVISNFVFGHQLSVDKEINNLLWEFDPGFHMTINEMEFVVEFPYHGGQCAGDTYSCIFGVNITDDDNNPDYVEEVREAKEDDYLESYNKFVTAFIQYLNEEYQEYEEAWVAGGDVNEEVTEFNKMRSRIIKFLEINKPGFYSVESSS